MANALTIEQLEAAKTTYLDAGNLSGFYTYMAGQGYNYAKLAGGLVDGTSGSGAVALGFMKQSAAAQGVTLTDTQISQIEQRMAYAWVEALDAEGRQSGGAVSNDLSYAATAQFHTKTFSKFGLLPETWTLYTPGDVFGPENAEKMWQDTLNNLGSALGEAGVNLAIVANVAECASSCQDTAKKTSAKKWLDELFEPAYSDAPYLANILQNILHPLDGATSYLNGIDLGALVDITPSSITVGDTDNVVVGQANGETITIGGGNNLVIATGSGNTVNIEAIASNANSPGINIIYAGTGGDTINFDTGNGSAGFIVLPVRDFSIHKLFNLDRTSLIAAVNSVVAQENWTNFETVNTSGLSGFDWTIILTPQSSPAAETIQINGAPITRFMAAYSSEPNSGDAFNPWPDTAWMSNYGYGKIYTISQGALVISDIPTTIDSLSLDQYLSHSTGGVASGPGGPGGDGSSTDVAGYLADPAKFDSLAGGFRISDSAANVGDSLDALSASANLIAITLTDEGTPVLEFLPASWVANDTSALDKIAGPYTITVFDTPDEILANLDALNANLNVVSIRTTGGGLTQLSVQQALNDTRALNIMANTRLFAVSDTAANVSAYFDSLNAAQLSWIELTDAGTPVLTLSVTQMLNDTTALGEISDPYQIYISDTAAAVSAEIDVLNADTRVTSIALTDPGVAVLTLTAAQASANALALSKISTPYTLVVSDGPSSVSASYFLVNRGSLDATGSISISDSAASTAALDQINADANVVSVDLSGALKSTLEQTIALALTDAGALGKIVTPYGLALADSASSNGDGTTKTLGHDSLGELTRSETDGPNGRVIMHYGITGQAYTSYEQAFDANWNLLSETLYNSDGSESIQGFADNLILAGGSGNDTLTGGGANETFVFKPMFGIDIIMDFETPGPGMDHIDFQPGTFSDLASVIAGTQQVGSDTVITLDAANAITVKNVAVSSLNQTQFHFG